MPKAKAALLVVLSFPGVCCGFTPPDPEVASAWLERGDRHFAAGEYVRAAAAYTEAIEAGDASVASLCKRAEANLFAENYDLAIADANRIIATDANCAEAFRLRGAANRVLGKHEDAIRDLSKAISIRPTALCLNLRGTTYRQLRDYDAAVRDYSEAIRTDPKRVNTYINRANVHRVRRDYDRAIEDLSAAIRLDPTVILAYEMRNDVYTAMGRDADAKIDREQATKLRANEKRIPGSGSPDGGVSVVSENNTQEDASDLPTVVPERKGPAPPFRPQRKPRVIEPDVLGAPSPTSILLARVNARPSQFPDVPVGFEHTRPIGDRDLAELKRSAELAKLKELNVSNTYVTDEGLRYLKGLDQLETLDLSYTDITDNGLVHLQSLNNLTALSLRDTLISSGGLSVLAALENLQSLNISFTAIDDEAMRHVTECTSLQSLNISNTRVTNAGVKRLVGLTQLEKLRFARTNVTLHALLPLQDRIPLKHVNLFQTPIRNLGDLRGFEQLESIQFHCKIVVDGREGLRELPQVKSLFFFYNRITPGGMDVIKSMPNLEVLSLRFCRDVDDDLLAGIGRMPKLRVIDLTGARITEASYRELSEIETLEEIRGLPKNATGLQLAILSEASALKSLDLDSADMPVEDLSQLRSFTHLNHLSLEYCNADGTTLEAISALDKLNAVNLSGTAITDADLKHLTNLTSLEKLDLSSTDIDGSGLVALTELPAITFLRLSRTEIGANSIDILKRFKHLQTLDVAKTLLTADEVERLQNQLPDTDVRY